MLTPLILLDRACWGETTLCTRCSLRLSSWLLLTDRECWEKIPAACNPYCTCCCTAPLGVLLDRGCFEAAAVHRALLPSGWWFIEYAETLPPATCAAHPPDSIKENSGKSPLVTNARLVYPSSWQRMLSVKPPPHPMHAEPIFRALLEIQCFEDAPCTLQVVRLQLQLASSCTNPWGFTGQKMLQCFHAASIPEQGRWPTVHT